VRSTAGSTISTIGTTVTRGIGSNGSSLLPEYRQRRSSVLGNEQRAELEEEAHARVGSSEQFYSSRP